jgi:hypothetical protein
MANDQNQKKPKYPQPMSIPAAVFWTGFFGGVFWSTMGFFAYYFHFTKIHPNVVLVSWVVGDWKRGWQGTIISIIIIGFLSVGAAFIYYAFLKRFNGIWPGILYGFVIFLVVFFVFNPFLPSMGPVNKLNTNTIITSICLYIIYGLFIGYSISYEYSTRKMAKEEQAT